MWLIIDNAWYIYIDIKQSEITDKSLMDSEPKIHVDHEFK